MASSSRQRDYWPYFALAVIVLLIAGNIFQYWRYRDLEIRNQLLKQNAEKFLDLATKLERSLKREAAEDNAAKDKN